MATMYSVEKITRHAVEERRHLSECQHTGATSRGRLISAPGEPIGH